MCELVELLLHQLLNFLGLLIDKKKTHSSTIPMLGAASNGSQPFTIILKAIMFLQYWTDETDYFV